MGGRLEDRVAIVTGGATGIGKATVERFLREGASVMIAGFVEEDNHRAIEELGALGSVDAVQTDVRNDEEVRAAVAQTLETFGQIDVLVNVAGVARTGPKYWEVQEEDWDLVLDTNLKGTWLFCRAVIPHMIDRGFGTIINTASQLAFAAVPGFGAYPVSKAGLVHFGHCLALEVAKHGIRVNTMCPGGTDTAQLRGAFPEGEGALGHLDDLIKAHPIGRLGHPEEIAAAIAFLASDEASFMVGTDLLADGGYNLT